MQDELFHGTGHWFPQGGIVRPTQHPAKVNPPAAWSSSDISVAAEYAGNKARKEGALFGPIFSVSPTSPKSELVTGRGVPNSHGDPRGLRVGRLAAFGSHDGKVL